MNAKKIFSIILLLSICTNGFTDYKDTFAHSTSLIYTNYRIATHKLNQAPNVQNHNKYYNEARKVIRTNYNNRLVEVDLEGKIVTDLDTGLNILDGCYSIEFDEAAVLSYTHDDNGYLSYIGEASFFSTAHSLSAPNVYRDVRTVEKYGWGPTVKWMKLNETLEVFIVYSDDVLTVTYWVDVDRVDVVGGRYVVTDRNVIDMKALSDGPVRNISGLEKQCVSIDGSIVRYCDVEACYVVDIEGDKEEKYVLPWDDGVFSCVVPSEVNGGQYMYLAKGDDKQTKLYRVSDKGVVELKTYNEAFDLYRIDSEDQISVSWKGFRRQSLLLTPPEYDLREYNDAFVVPLYKDNVSNDGVYYYSAEGNRYVDYSLFDTPMFILSVLLFVLILVSFIPCKMRFAMVGWIIRAIMIIVFIGTIVYLVLLIGRIPQQDFSNEISLSWFEDKKNWVNTKIPSNLIYDLCRCKNEEQQPKCSSNSPITKTCKEIIDENNLCALKLYKYTCSCSGGLNYETNDMLPKFVKPHDIMVSIVNLLESSLVLTVCFSAGIALLLAGLLFSFTNKTGCAATIVISITAFILLICMGGALIFLVSTVQSYMDSDEAFSYPTVDGCYSTTGMYSNFTRFEDMKSLKYYYGSVYLAHILPYQFLMVVIGVILASLIIRMIVQTIYTSVSNDSLGENELRTVWSKDPYARIN